MQIASCTASIETVAALYGMQGHFCLGKNVFCLPPQKLDWHVGIPPRLQLQGFQIKVQGGIPPIFEGPVNPWYSLSRCDLARSTSEPAADTPNVRTSMSGLFIFAIIAVALLSGGRAVI